VGLKAGLDVWRTENVDPAENRTQNVQAINPTQLSWLNIATSEDNSNNKESYLAFMCVLFPRRRVYNEEK
jgi:hypothetical protein